MRPKNVTWPDRLSLNNFRIAPKIGSENPPKTARNPLKIPRKSVNFRRCIFVHNGRMWRKNEAEKSLKNQ